MAPLTETASPVSTEAAMYTTVLTRGTSTPRCMASFSPASSRFKSDAVAYDEARRKKSHTQRPGHRRMRGRGKIAHQPERHSPQVSARQRGHQEHDDRGEKRSCDDSSEQQRPAVDLPSAPSEVINGHNRHQRAKKRSHRREQRRHFRRKV